MTLTANQIERLLCALEAIAKRMPGPIETDHPLMGETFGPLADAIRSAGETIREGLETLAKSIDDMAERGE